MRALQITEADTVQFSMVRHVTEAGWTPIPTEIALWKRGGEAGMLFRGELDGALRQFMTDDAIRSAVERLEAIPPLIEGNRERLALLDRADDGLALREIRAQSGPQTNERRLREDLAILKDRGLVAAMGYGPGCALEARPCSVAARALDNGRP